MRTMETRTLDWRVKAFLVGGLVGTAFGLTAAYLYVQSIEKEGTTPELQPREAVSIGLSALAVLRQVAALHKGDGKAKMLH
jgi:hypothetical protein